MYLLKVCSVLFFTISLMLSFSHTCYSWPSEFLPWTPYVVYSDGKEIKMSIEPSQLRDLIGEVLSYLNLHSDDAVELLMLTAAQESHCGRYIKQIRGPALGIFQMEPATERDIWKHYLAYNDDLRNLINGLLITEFKARNYSWDLKANLVYQIAIARVHYLRDKHSIPSKDNMVEMARYYKKVWNTHKGKATWEEALSNYTMYGKE